MSKVLVVVYSHTGTSRQLAALLCRQQGWTLAEIVEERPRRGIVGYGQCLIDSVLRRRPAIRYSGPPPHEYDAVVLVSPIWAFQIASPMRSFIMHRPDRLPDVAVISVMGASSALNALHEVSQMIGRTPILHAAFTQREVEDGSCAQRLQSFGAAIAGAQDSKGPAPPGALSPQAA
ncbi:flavodoxin [Variovorax sp. J22R133]|uniref:flavodoxin family protein n=1 Tax=Variovorax brevis TaxID=3053503 RepID=UPI002574C257|nr:flavodoxin [Variovorax sp. J22R133]MDM0116353.1 flavodoxin [Variovorax sp. J22R133]